MPAESKRESVPSDDAAAPETTSPTHESGASGPEGVADPLAQAQAEGARLKDALLRTAADFDNFRKRSRRELDEARRGGREEVIKALLPIFDNLDRAIQSSARATDVKPVIDGLSMVHRQFVDALGKEGILRVPTVGSAFDPSVHEAIQQVVTDEHAPGTVIAEVQSGYTQGDRLLRAAMVVVARARSGPEESGEDSPVN
jgi:molecular chaperone GrpE